MTCGELIYSATLLETESDYCQIFGKINKSDCCPPEETPAPTPMPHGVDNPCIICPNGATAGDNLIPYPNSTNPRTCAEIIDAAKLSEIGSDDCGYFEFSELLCCFVEPEIPCIICPDGATATDDYVPEYEGNTLTCSGLIESATQFESRSDECRLYAIDVAFCCPP